MHREQKELIKDVANIAIGFTPVWWAIAISRFTHKWGYERRGIKRMHRHLFRKGRRKYNLAMTEQELERLLR